MIILTILFAGSLLGVFLFKGDNSLLSVIYATCLALFVSSIFYGITTLLPEVRRRKRIQRGLKKQYRSFKRRCIDLFLISSKSQDYESRDNLLNHKEFRRYFNLINDNGQSRWDLVATSVDDQDYIFDEIVRELNFLNREIDFARSSVDMDDEKVEDFFINLSEVIHTIKAAEANTDDYKHFCRTLWSIFTRWNSLQGQLEEDIIETMIDKI